MGGKIMEVKEKGIIQMSKRPLGRLERVIKYAIKDGLQELSDASNSVKSEERYLVTKDVADYLGFSEKAVRNAAREGRLPAYKILGDWRFRISEVDRTAVKAFRKQKGKAVSVWE